MSDDLGDVFEGVGGLIELVGEAGGKLVKAVAGSGETIAGAASALSDAAGTVGQAAGSVAGAAEPLVSGLSTAAHAAAEQVLEVLWVADDLIVGEADRAVAEAPPADAAARRARRQAEEGEPVPPAGPPPAP